LIFYHRLTQINADLSQINLCLVSVNLCKSVVK
jgi:hypothetical protein